MYGFMQRNGKKLLAVIGVALMVVFIIPPSMMNGGSGPGDSVIGNFGGAPGKGGTPITAGELQQASAQLQELTRIVRREKENYIPLPLYGLAQRVGGQAARPAFDALTGDKAAYWLLLQEADRSGTAASAEDVDQTLDGLLYRPAGTRDPAEFVPVDALPAETRKQVRAVTAGWLAVMARFDRARDAMKISRPVVERAVGRGYQQIDLSLVSFPAADYAEKVPAATDAQLETFFKQHADQVAGEASAENPFGFGYRVPAGVKYQYVSLPTAAVEEAVRGEKSQYDWEVLARKYYLEHPEEFRPVPPPVSESTTEPATQPALPPFDQVRDQAVEAVFRPAVQARREAILAVVRQKMKGDDASMSALKSLVADVQKQFGVPLAPADRTSSFQTQEQLAAEPGLGKATATVGTGLSAQEVPFTQYALAAATPQDESNPVDPGVNLKVMQPSEPLEQTAAPVGPVSADTPVPATYVFRLTAAEPPHAATDLAPVKQRVAADWKREQAFGLAKKAADAVVDKARDTTLASAAGDRKIFQTGPFGAYNFRPESAGLPTDTAPAAAQAFAQGALDLLSLPAKTEHPTGRIDLPALGRSMAATVTSVRPVWTDPQQREMLDGMVAGQLRQTLSQLAAGTEKSNWFAPASINARVGYAPSARQSAAPNGPAAPAPPMQRIGS